MSNEYKKIAEDCLPPVGDRRGAPCGTCRNPVPPAAAVDNYLRT